MEVGGRTHVNGPEAEIITKRMRTRATTAVVGALLAVGAGGLPASATGHPTATYHGSFTGPVVFLKGGAPCPGAPVGAVATGGWSLKDRDGKTAILSVNIFVNGAHHVAFGAALPVTVVDGATFAAGPLTTLAGDLRVWVAGDTFTYQITPYTALDGSYTCDSGTYTGSVSH